MYKSQNLGEMENTKLPNRLSKVYRAADQRGAIGTPNVWLPSNAWGWGWKKTTLPTKCILLRLPVHQTVPRDSKNKLCLAKVYEGDVAIQTLQMRKVRLLF